MGSSCFLHTKTLRHSLKITAWNSCQHLFFPPPQIKMQKSQHSPSFHPPLMLMNSLLAASTPLLCRKGHVLNLKSRSGHKVTPSSFHGISRIFMGSSTSWIASEECLSLQGQKYHWQETYVAGMMWWDVQHDIQRQWARSIWKKLSHFSGLCSQKPPDLQEQSLSRHNLLFAEIKNTMEMSAKVFLTSQGYLTHNLPPQQPYHIFITLFSLLDLTANSSSVCPSTQLCTMSKADTGLGAAEKTLRKT